MNFQSTRVKSSTPPAISTGTSSIHSPTRTMSPTRPPTPPQQSTESISKPKLVVHQDLTPPQTPPDQEVIPTTQMRPNPTAAANVAGSAVPTQPVITEVKAGKGKSIILRQGGKLYETANDSDDWMPAQPAMV